MAQTDYQYGTGLNNVGSYQASGKPFVTGSLSAIDGEPLKISFPAVTRWIYVINHSTAGAGHCKIGFSENGLAGTNFIRLGPQTSNEGTQHSERLEIKVTEVYFTGSDDFDLIAGLTGIDIERINNISTDGTNWSGSSGIG